MSQVKAVDGSSNNGRINIWKQITPQFYFLNIYGTSIMCQELGMQRNTIAVLKDLRLQSTMTMQKRLLQEVYNVLGESRKEASL